MPASTSSAVRWSPGSTPSGWLAPNAPGDTGRPSEVPLRRSAGAGGSARRGLAVSTDAPSPLSAGPGMGSVMDRLQPLDSDVGVELRGGERSVTKQLLDRPEIR